MDMEPILERIKKVNSDYFFWNDEVLINQLKEIAPDQLKEVLNKLFKEMIEECPSEDPVEKFERVISMIPLKKLEEAAECQDGLEKAKEMLEKAKLYIHATEKQSPTLYRHLSAILEALISLIEGIINAFGLQDFFTPAESALHADFKSQRIMMILSLFTMLSGMMIPILGAQTAALIIGGTLLAIAALSIIWPYIKPMTSFLPANAENLTKQAQNGAFMVHGRKESLNEMARIIESNRHPILVGPSRVGKSLTARAFAQAIERGDYPKLQGKRVFLINTADLLDQQASLLGGSSNILNKISDAMGRHRDDIVLVLDEVHMACKNKAKISDQLKTFLDEGGDFPHVIGITTEEEYEHVKSNQAFSNRFDKVPIGNTTPEETLKILSDVVVRTKPQPIIDQATLKYIYEKTKDRPQPSAALKLLKSSIGRTGKTQKSPAELAALEDSNKIESLRMQSVASRSRKDVSKEEMDALEQHLEQLQEKLSDEKQAFDALFQAKELLDRVTRESYQSVVKISKFAKGKLDADGEKEVKKFMLMHHLFMPALETYIKETSSNLGVKAIIDEQLIDELIPVG